MSLYQSCYFMSLVGGLAGLCAWILTTLLQHLLSFPALLPDFVPAMLLGGFLGALTVGFDEHWSGKRVEAAAVLTGAGIGLLAGIVAALLSLPIRNATLRVYPMAYRVLVWTIVGALIGLGLALRRSGMDGSRLGNPVTGGLLGGVASGLLFTLAGSSYPDVTNALCFTLSGVGICSGLTLTPMVAREAVLLFVRSGDAQAQAKKFGRGRKEVGLTEGRTYVIGRGEITPGPREASVTVPDASIAPRHAILYARQGRYYIARHDENRAPAAMSRYPLKVGGRSVTSARAIEHLDDITIGKTALKFQIRTRETR